MKMAHHMTLVNRLHDLFVEQAAATRIDRISIGLGYTAVTTRTGGTGLAYTYFEDKKSCQVIPDLGGFEGRPAHGLLKKIMGRHPVERSVALALINALNHRAAMGLPEDPENNVLFHKMGIEPGARVALVGYFHPLVQRMSQNNIEYQVLDFSRNIGNKRRFYDLLQTWADVLLLTSTSIINQTAEEIMAQTGNRTKTVLLGPSTPMVPRAFNRFRIQMLAGMVPLDMTGIMRAIRLGMGTPVLKRFCRKSYVLMD